MSPSTLLATVCRHENRVLAGLPVADLALVATQIRDRTLLDDMAYSCYSALRERMSNLLFAEKGAGACPS